MSVNTVMKNKMVDGEAVERPAQETNPLLPVAILIDELKHDDVSVRLNSVRRLNEIAAALGPERTREELIPYLNEFVDDEDDVLLALAAALGELLPFVGGSEHVHTLLMPLETLAGVEEPSLRDKSVNSCIQIAKAMPKEHIEEYLFPMVCRLAEGDWFTSRVSSCSLFKICYADSSAAAKAKLRKLYATLCSDSTPMVRRAACSQVGEFCLCVEPDLLPVELVPAFIGLAKDDQDSVRLLTVENCVIIGGCLPDALRSKFIVPLVLDCCRDASWRVRYMAATKYIGLCKTVGPNLIKSDMLNSFVSLLEDKEPEVRTAAAAQVTLLAELIPKDLVLKKLLPPIQKLVTDASQFVRSSLASVIMGLARVVERDHVFEHLLPLFLILLRDEDPDVRLNIISKLDAVNQVIGLDFFTQQLLPTIIDLALDKKWRVRLAIIERIPILAEQLGPDFFEEKLRDICISWLTDEVFSIREAASKILLELVKIFGVKWTRRHIIEKITQLVDNSNYLYRMIALTASTDLAAELSEDVIAADLLPTVFRLAKDPVPNVRFNAAKTLQKLSPLLSSDVVEAKVKPCLKKLLGDSDFDVSYYAQKALESAPK